MHIEKTAELDFALRVAQGIDEHRLLEGVRRLGLAVSGGADSMALARVLIPLCQQRNIGLVVLHLNHGLRNTAAEDAAFVQHAATQWQLPFRTQTLDLAGTASNGLSLEMRARQARLAFYAQCVASEHLDTIATGHHADDAVESLLLRLSRGSGSSGLTALRPRTAAPQALPNHPYLFIRPLLAESSAAIRDWLTHLHQPWRTDESNADQSIPRNRVRHAVLPLLDEALPTFRTSALRSIELLRGDDDYLQEQTVAFLREHTVDDALAIAPLRSQHCALQRRVLRCWLMDRGCVAGFETIERLRLHLRDENGSMQLAETCDLVIDHGRLRLAERAAVTEVAAATALPLEGDCVWNGVWFEVRRTTGYCAEAHGLYRYPATCCLALDYVTAHPLVIRSRQPGDRIAPLGLTGSKKLQDLFVDEKIPEALRANVPVVAHGDTVIWIPGYRIAAEAAVASATAPSVRITATN